MVDFKMIYFIILFLVFFTVFTLKNMARENVTFSDFKNHVSYEVLIKIF